MIGKLLVFVSSTSDLAAERKALKALINEHSGVYEGYFYEDDPARNDRPEDRCRIKIESADVFVSVLGAQYGSPYPPPGESGSIVEWEFETAQSRTDLGLLAVAIKRLPQEQVEPPQRKFIDRVKSFRGKWCREYSSTEELQREVERSLIQWSAEIVLRVLNEQQSEKLHHRRFLIPLAVGSVLVLNCFFLASSELEFSSIMLLGFCILECALLLTLALILVL